NAAASSNTVTVNQSAALVNVGTAIVGNGRVGAPTLNATGNILSITNGGQVVAGTVRVGTIAGDNNNAVQVLDGGLLEANTLTVLAGSSGNTISNRHGIYQFTTATPSITPNGAGSIAITDGTISFRGIDNADVNANQSGGPLNPITFAGANTFML